MDNITQRALSFLNKNNPVSVFSNTGMGKDMINSMETYPQRNQEIMGRAMRGDPNAGMQVMQSLPMLSMSLKGSTVAKKALQLMANKIHPDDLLAMSDFTAYARNSKNIGAMGDPFKYEAGIRDMAQHYGLNPEMNNKRLANQFTKVLDLAWKRVAPYLNKLK